MQLAISLFSLISLYALAGTLEYDMKQEPIKPDVAEELERELKAQEEIFGAVKR
jgi:hypothetical protein